MASLQIAVYSHFGSTTARNVACCQFGSKTTTFRVLPASVWPTA